MPRTTAPSINPRILSGYAPYADHLRSKCSASATEGRRQLLLDDPHARDVQPEQVTCTRCTKTVRLQKGKKYHLAHWLDHRWRCDHETADPPPRAKCLTLIERKAVLEADEDAEVVESDRVVCGRCGREVKLRKGRPYGLSCWNQHKSMCYMMSPQPSVPARSASGSTSPSLPHPDSETHMYNPLISDPLVASIEPQRIKCALCLTWIDFGPSKDLVWHRHRTSCVADNFTDHKLGWTHPRFFRPRYPLPSGSEMIDHHLCDSSAAENLPPSQHSPGSIAKKALDQTYTGKTSPTVRVENNFSSSPSTSPPPLSFSTASSTDSEVSTPLPSPRRRPSLFPDSRYLPLPAQCLCRAQFSLEKRERSEKAGFCALGLHLTPPRSFSPASDRSLPPPYLERTPIILPMPGRYWRFENVN